MMHIAYSPYFHKIYKYPPISEKFMNLLPACVQFTLFGLIYVFCFPNYFGHGAFARTGRPSLSLYMFLFLSLFLYRLHVSACLALTLYMFCICLSFSVAVCMYAYVSGTSFGWGHEGIFPLNLWGKIYYVSVFIVTQTSVVKMLNYDLRTLFPKW